MMDASQTQTESTALAQIQPSVDSTSENRKVTIDILRNVSLTLLSSLLNPTKIIPTEAGILRDWRGLAQLCGISGQYLPSLKEETDPTSKILRMWIDKDKAEATIEKLLKFLEQLERFDIVDDLTPLIEEDLVYHNEHPPNLMIQPILKVDKSILTRDDLERVKKGLEPQFYHGFLLFDDADIAFASEVIEKMENEYLLKLCVRRRDLLAGIPEIEAVIQLITERCRRLIVIVSQAFFASEENGTHKFFYDIAQGIAIEQRCRKIIPCIYNDIGRLPAEIQYYSKIDFRRPYPNWERLRNSLVTPDDIPAITVTPPVITETPAERPRILPEHSVSNPNPGLKSIIHAKGHGSKHVNEHVKFKSSSTGNIPEAETEEKSSTSHISSSTINLDILDDTKDQDLPDDMKERDRIKKKNAFRSDINKFFDQLTGTFTLKRTKSKSNGEKKFTNGVKDISPVMESPVDKNHVEENGRKADDSTTEKEKKEEKSEKIEKKTKKKVKNWFDSLKKRRKNRALVAE